MDKITLDRIELLHPALRDEAKAIYKEICQVLTGRALCRFAYTLRTYAEQNALYAQGRTTPGAKVTQAKGGQSYHNFGLAIDIVLLIDKDGNGSFESASWETKVDFDGDGKSDWQEVVNIFKQYGWAWGGDWKFTDKPHFEKTFVLMS
jgi:peptidoglycan L-alanyl-D-glutamate endopeptidase CwlK